ncbi:hypothetical protein WME89_24870 [Sorangium sp. So ce321]|uniref:hypothetical protein n=1 Tax=Sorangium sp. So ce321 TaxID=3133300 RepID=UPI003F5E50C5
MLSLSLFAGCASSEVVEGGDAGGGGAAAECPIPPMDRITWSLTTAAGTTFSSENPVGEAGDPPTQSSIEGQVVSSTPGEIAIDSCAPDADCDQAPTTLTLAASGLPDVLVPEGAFVRLDFQAQRERSGYGDYGDYTGMHLNIENLSEWRGLSNPVATDDRVWLAAHERFVTGGPNSLTADFDPFTVERLDVCFSTEFGNPVYAMRFSMPDASPSSVTLNAGEEASITITGAHAGEYTFRNLRSFEYAEPGHEFAYWLAFSEAP